MRVVLYAEGGGETRGAVTLLPAPGEVLRAEHEGAGHVLLRRALAQSRQVAVESIVFLAPLRTRRGRVARGNDLLDRGTLRQLLAWPLPDRRPDLAVVLIDRSGWSGAAGTGAP